MYAGFCKRGERKENKTSMNSSSESCPEMTGRKGRGNHSYYVQNHYMYTAYLSQFGLAYTDYVFRELSTSGEEVDFTPV